MAWQKKFQKEVNVDDDVSVVDDDSWGFGGSGKATIKDIVLRHIRKISDLSCKEFTPSYFSKKPVNLGGGIALIETYHEDTRLAYCNAVDFLLDIIIPHTLDDEEFKVVQSNLTDEEKKGFEDFQKANKKQDEWIWAKLEYRRKLFKEIMLVLERINFFGEEVYSE